MEQETTRTETAESPAPPAAESKSSGEELLEELSRLGHKFAQVVKVAWNSEQRKQIEQDLKAGLSSLAHNLEDGLKQVSESEQAKDLLDKAEDVAESLGEKVRSSKIANDLAAGLSKGLRSLSEEMEKLAQEIQSKDETASAEPNTGEPKDIPVNKG